MRHHAVRVPATSANLGPGFDAFGFAVQRYLFVRSVPRAEQPERVRPVGPLLDPGAASGIPTGDENLVWRSVVAFCDAHGVPVPDVALVTASQIPLERGLGSSSSAIVAGLVLARALTEVEHGDRELVAFAAELEGHPDNVAPALLGGLVACTVDDGGGLVLRRVNPGPTLRPAVLVPDTRQATGAARAVLPEVLGRDEVVIQAGRAAHVLAALTGTWPVVPAAAGDLLHEPARLEVMPATGAALRALRSAGVHAWLSGAGPAVATALRTDDVDQHAVVAAVAAEHSMAFLPTAYDLSGAYACPTGGCSLAGAGECAQCPFRSV